MPPDTFEWLMCSDRHITMVRKTTYTMSTKLIQLMLQNSWHFIYTTYGHAIFRKIFSITCHQLTLSDLQNKETDIRYNQVNKVQEKWRIWCFSYHSTIRIQILKILRPQQGVLSILLYSRNETPFIFTSVYCLTLKLSTRKPLCTNEAVCLL